LLSAFFEVLITVAEGVSHLFGHAVGRHTPRVGQRFCARFAIPVSGRVLHPSRPGGFSLVLPIGTRIRIVRESDDGEDGCGAVFANDESLIMLPSSLHATARAYGYTLELTARDLQQSFSLERIRKTRAAGH